ncbi:hypothetical protein [Rugosimonospora africana]|uniref:Uncharacterized protein n=1 Tax=Rugosimonospora africana TaxID=556532 RepID=A0A8J3QP41_9ACTN|nr:hypothetical protein [Rugosimonospora africana]GIH13774.1 hypothetical protein Raf01_19460 [Rugosimonospora africana]
MSIPATDFYAPPVTRWRRTAGLVAGVLALLALAGTVLGAWNPTSLVLVHQYLGDPVRDLFFAMLLALIAYWVGVPVTSEAAQHGRVVARAWLVVLTALVGVAALTTWGLAVFRYQPQVIARSADGQRAVALVTVLRGRQLHAFAGSGVGARDQGNLGRPCGPSVVAEFTGDDEVRVTTNYGTFDLRLDPATGRPVRGLGPTCSG